MCGDAIYRGSHGMFADAKSDVVPGIAPDATDSAGRGRSAKFGILEIAFAFQSSVSGRVKIG